MRINTHHLIIILFFLSAFAQAQVKDGVWNNKKCAVALTYDDGLNVHLDLVVPALDSMDFKGTFYVPGNSSVLNDRMSEWASIADIGHELGNHTLFHPCAGKSKGREWVSPDYDLDDYSINQIVDEIRLANTLLKAIDGKSDRTLAYTCGDISIGDSVFIDLIKKDVVGARGVLSKFDRVNEIDVYNISSFMIHEQSGDDLIKLVKKAQESGQLLVFLFHGVGGEHSLNVSLEAHNQLLSYLKKYENDIWVASMVEIAEFVRAHNNTHPDSTEKKPKK